MPDRADSIGYGTSTVSDRFRPTGGVLNDEVPANCHWPLRLCQSGRVSCGRGYSGSGFVVETWSVQGVVNGGTFGTRAACAGCGPTRTATSGTSAAASAMRGVDRNTMPPGEAAGA